ncbi:hypothetical protein C4580_02890 [Candidatus Woesearchaeota archaeon]|nr:MAG: hypothetical protein C4580_02890 [Candidatus Woesearchaeota archaeon]
MELLMQATCALTALNVLLLILLTWLYGRNFLRLRSNFSLGLLLFTLAFLAHYATSLYFYLTNMAFYVDMVGVHVFVITLIQTIAFAVLSFISWT